MAFALLTKSGRNLQTADKTTLRVSAPNRERAPLFIQPKLTIGAPNDKFEQEADRRADEVMHMHTPSPQLQRACSCGGSCPSCQTPGESIQRSLKATGEPIHRSPDATVQRTLSKTGRPLEPAIRGFMETRFGEDFGQVRIHTDAEGGASAQSVHARAFTVGRDIVFGPGQFAPESSEGRRLLAHELTHVVQQGRLQTPSIQRVPILPSRFSRPTDYRVDTYQLTESDLMNPGVTAALRGMTKEQLRNYLEHVTDDAVRNYIFKLIAAAGPDAPSQPTCEDNCMFGSTSLERVSHTVGPTFDVMGCYEKLAASAAKVGLTPEAGCAQCLMNCKDTKMDLDEAITTCRDALLNNCIELTESWKHLVLHGL